MKVLVIGASGGSGRQAVQHLLAAGHEVTAFCRRAEAMGTEEGLRVFVGDAMEAADVERAVAGHDAVVVALGITENPLRVRLFGPARTPIDVRSTGTRHVIAAMHRHGVRKLVVQTTYGVGNTRERLRFVDRMFFELLLKPQIADTERQNQDVVESGLDWVLVQPVHLTDRPSDELPFVSLDGSTGGTAISRASVGRFIADAVTRQDLVGHSVALSAPLAA